MTHTLRPSPLSGRQPLQFGITGRFVIALLLALAPLPAQALNKTFWVPYAPSWDYARWGCGNGSNLPILRSGTWPTSFAGSLPTGSKVTNLKATIPMRRAGLFYASGDSNPFVGITISGQ